MTGRRIQNLSDLDENVLCYYKGEDGCWMLYIPGCGLGSLARHIVQEHEDGTISVHPSILMKGHESGQAVTRHGYLTRGVWRDG